MPSSFQTTPSPRHVLINAFWNAKPLIQAFQALGYTVWENATAADIDGLSPDDVLLYLTNLHADIKHPWAALQRKKVINQRHAPVIFWDRDGPSHMGDKAWRLWLMKHLSFIDIYASHTLQDAGHFAEEVIYLPNAAWEEVYNLRDHSLAELRDPGFYRHDVSFFGRIDPKRFPETHYRAQFIALLREKLAALGIDFFVTDQSLSADEQVQLIQTSRINLSCFAGCDVRYQGGYHGEPFSGGLPERCYGIPACGGFVLNDRRAHAHDDFTPDVDWIDFRDLDECVAKIRHFLSHFDHLRSVAEAAHHTVMSRHRYRHRAEKLQRFVRYWRQKKGHEPVAFGFPLNAVNKHSA